jgi:transcription antitermination factor NusG
LGDVVTLESRPWDSEGASLPWHAIHVRSQHEKLVSGRLEAAGIEYFSPTYQSLRTWSDRRKWIELPLYPGYVFARFAPSERGEVVRIPGSLHILGGIQEHEIEAVRRLVESQLPVAPYPCLQFRPGDQVMVERGPLKGIVGTVVEHRSKTFVVVQIEMLGRATAAQIDPAWLKSEQIAA